jgi:hypothetical protein
VPIIDLTNKQSNSSFRGRLVTRLIQYAAVISEEYLQKFDDPYRFHDCALYIYQNPLHVEQPMGICQAIKNASGVHDPKSGLKRKVLGDIMGAGRNTARETKRARYEKDDTLVVSEE